MQGVQNACMTALEHYNFNTDESKLIGPLDFTLKSLTRCGEWITEGLEAGKKETAFVVDVPFDLIQGNALGGYSAAFAREVNALVIFLIKKDQITATPLLPACTITMVTDKRDSTSLVALIQSYAEIETDLGVIQNINYVPTVPWVGTLFTTVATADEIPHIKRLAQALGWIWNISQGKV